MSATVDDAVVLVVADGAGSASRSHEGADRLVQSFVDAADHLLRDEDGAEIDRVRLGELSAKMWQRVLHDHVRWLDQQPLDRREYQSTLLGAILLGPWIAATSVGDGFLYVEAEGDGRLVLPPSDRMGQFSNEVRFVGPRSTPTTSLIWEPRCTAVLLSTDGLEKWLDQRIVEQCNGDRQPRFWSVQPTLPRLVGLLRDGDEEQFRSMVEHPGLMRRKGDDIGVAVAVR